MEKEPAIAKTKKLFRDYIRLKQMKYSTEKSYLGWAVRYVAFLYDDEESIKGMKSLERFEHFLTKLAYDEVAAATQSQAYHAIKCLYINVWKKKMEGVDALRCKRRPVERLAPSVDDINRAFAHVKDTPEYPILLILHLIYGTGMRVSEACRLRIKDLHFSAGKIIVHDSKGKDRFMAIPEVLAEPLKHQVQIAIMKARIDISNGTPVKTPGKISTKDKSAPYSAHWHYAFPKQKLCAHPRTGEIVRYHILPSSLQRALKTACKAADLMQPFTPHNLRHAYATHLLDRGANPQGVQKSMGHTKIETTFGYVHTDALTVGSPLDAPKPKPIPDQIIALPAASNLPGNVIQHRRIS